MKFMVPQGYHQKTQEYVNSVNGDLSLLYIYNEDGDQVTVATGFELDAIVRRIVEAGSAEVVSLTEVTTDTRTQWESGVQWQEGVSWK
jgi:hypothetical protein